MIACVCIVAKENNPLLLRVFPQADGEDIKFHHICYCSIDVFEEREQSMRLVLSLLSQRGLPLFLSTFTPPAGACTSGVAPHGHTLT